MNINDIPIDATTPLGRAAVRWMNEARRAGAGVGVRERIGEPVRLAIDPDGGEVLVQRSGTGPRVLWLCVNLSVEEAIHYLRQPARVHSAVWRESIVERLAPWGNRIR